VGVCILIELLLSGGRQAPSLECKLLGPQAPQVLAAPPSPYRRRGPCCGTAGALGPAACPTQSALHHVAALEEWFPFLAGSECCGAQSALHWEWKGRRYNMYCAGLAGVTASWPPWVQSWALWLCPHHQQHRQHHPPPCTQRRGCCCRWGAGTGTASQAFLMAECPVYPAVSAGSAVLRCSADCCRKNGILMLAR